MGGVGEPGRSERRKKSKSGEETGVFNRPVHIDDEVTSVFKKPARSTRSERVIPVSEKNIIDEEEVVDLDKKILPVTEEDILEVDGVVQLRDKITPLEDSDILEMREDVKLLTPEDHKENSRKRVEKSNKAKKPSQDTIDALQMVRDISTPTGEALAEVRELSSSHNDPEVVAKRNADKEELAEAKATHDLVMQDYKDEAEEVNDLEKIREEIAHGRREGVKKLDEEIKAGFKNEDEQSGSRPKTRSVKENVGLKKEIKSESEKVKNAKIFAENAIQAYSKLFIEYYPDTANKIYDGKKESSDRVGAFDLVAITPPPLRAIFTAKGRQLRDVYGKVQEAIKKYNDEVEAS